MWRPIHGNVNVVLSALNAEDVAAISRVLCTVILCEFITLNNLHNRYT